MSIDRRALPHIQNNQILETMCQELAEGVHPKGKTQTADLEENITRLQEFVAIVKPNDLPTLRADNYGNVYAVWQGGGTTLQVTFTYNGTYVITRTPE